MGIRGVDIQIAIQRAADADKIQQAQTAQARAGEAAIREEGELEKARSRERTHQTERTGQPLVRTRKEGGYSGNTGKAPQEGSEGDDDKQSGQSGESGLAENGHLDILA